MEHIDQEFNPIRKAQVSVNPDEIVKDVKIDHDQLERISKIKLIPIRKDVSTTTTTPVSQTNIDPTNKQDTATNKDSKEKRPILIEEDAELLKRIKHFKTNEESLILQNNKPIKKEQDIKFLEFKKYLLRQLNQSLPAEETFIPTYLKNCYSEIDRILKQSIVQKEPHSSILVGPRSSFKSFLLNHSLSLISQKFNNQYITIRLNGYVHSEQTAITSIASQIEQQLREKVPESTPAINDEQEDDSFSDLSSGSLTEVFEKILRLLDSATHFSSQNEEIQKDNSKKNKITVLFIFDEVDVFAGPVRQTLLYNLFDMVEQARIPVCIVGSTTKFNFIDFLEKRVKSRFSQRIISIPEINTFEEFKNAIRDFLTINEKNFENTYVKDWNTLINKLLDEKTSKIVECLKVNFASFKSIVRFNTSLSPLLHISRSFEELSKQITTCEHALKYEKNQLSTSLTAQIRSFSDLELAILIASARVLLKGQTDHVNFNLAYSEYESMVKALNTKIPSMVPLTTSNKSGASSSTIILDNAIKLWNKKDVQNVWENLINLEMLGEKDAVGLRESAMAVYYASNYKFHGASASFDLRSYRMAVTLQDLRKVVPKSSIYYQWTQL